jgi:hypothetical protein
MSNIVGASAASTGDSAFGHDVMRDENHHLDAPEAPITTSRSEYELDLLMEDFEVVLSPPAQPQGMLVDSQMATLRAAKDGCHRSVECDNDRMQIESFRAEIHEWKQEVEACRRDSTKLREEMAAMREEIAQMQTANILVTERAHIAESALEEMSGLRKEVAQLRKANTQVTQRAHEAEIALEECRAHGSQLTQKLAQAESQRDDYRSGKIALETEHNGEKQDETVEHSSQDFSNQSSSRNESQRNEFAANQFSNHQTWTRQRNGFWTSQSHSSWTGSASGSFQSVGGYWFQDSKGEWIYVTQSDIYRNSRNTIIQAAHGFWTQQEQGTWTEHSIGYWYRSNNGSWVETIESEAHSIQAGLGQALSHPLDGFLIVDSGAEAGETGSSSKTSGAGWVSSTQTNAGQSISRQVWSHREKSTREHSDLGERNQAQAGSSQDTSEQDSRDQSHSQYHETRFGHNGSGKLNTLDSRHDELQSEALQAGDSRTTLLGAGLGGLVSVACEHSMHSNLDQGSHEETFGQVPLSQGPFSQKPSEQIPHHPPPPPSESLKRPQPDQAPIMEPVPSDTIHSTSNHENTHQVGFHQGSSENRKSNQNETEKTSFSGVATQQGRSNDENSCKRLRKEIEKVRIHLQKVQSHLSVLEEEFKRTCACRTKEEKGIIGGLSGVGVSVSDEHQSGDVQSLLSGILGRK